MADPHIDFYNDKLDPYKPRICVRAVVSDAFVASTRFKLIINNEQDVRFHQVIGPTVKQVQEWLGQIQSLKCEQVKIVFFCLLSLL